MLDVALRFGGTGFYNFHVHFTNQAAGRIQQFNQLTLRGGLDSEHYCRIFAARTSTLLQVMWSTFPSHHWMYS